MPPDWKSAVRYLGGSEPREREILAHIAREIRQVVADLTGGTQVMVSVLNASRRLFSDRFLTSSFRPEFYSTLGLDWVNENGPQAMEEPIPNNGHDHRQWRRSSASCCA